ncbi:MAG: hypothetical protein DRO12_05240 [Thermoprotei archaeon]|nr:MAG: hypothetical protein DRO12_05240 [Thermoprotei archaeon]
MELKLVIVIGSPRDFARCVVIAEKLKNLLSEYLPVRLLISRAPISNSVILFDALGTIECHDFEEAMEKAMDFLEKVNLLGTLDVASGAKPKKLTG